MRIVLLALLLALAASPAGARPLRITVTPQDCDQLVRHVPDADVAYRPGVDVNGNPVAPADLPGTNPDLPIDLVVDITVSTARRLGIPGDPRLYKGEVPVGRVAVDPQGNATLNGVPLDDQTQAALAARCRAGRPAR